MKNLVVLCLCVGLLAIGACKKEEEKQVSEQPPAPGLPIKIGDITSYTAGASFAAL